MLNFPEIKSGLQFVLAFIENIELTQKIEKLGQFIELGQMCLIYTKKGQIKAIPIEVKETENGYVLVFEESKGGEQKELPMSDFSHITPTLEDLQDLGESPFIRKRGFSVYNHIGENVLLNAPTLCINNVKCKLIDFDMDGRVVVEIGGNPTLVSSDYQIQFIEPNEKA